MKYSKAVIGWWLCGLITAAALALNAAEQAAPPETAGKNVAEPNAAAAWQRRLPEFVSDNLPLDEIIRQLRQQFPEINFLIKQQDADIEVGAISVRMTLRAVTLPEILAALELAAQRPIQIAGGPDGRLVVFEAKVPAPPTDPATGLPVQPAILTRVFNMTRFLQSRPETEADVAMREVENVLHTAGEMLKDSNGGRGFDPKLNLHRGTKLLIAVGRPDELAVVEQVVMELQNPYGAPRIPERPPRGPRPGPGEPPPERRP